MSKIECSVYQYCHKVTKGQSLVILVQMLIKNTNVQLWSANCDINTSNLDQFLKQRNQK